MRLWHALDCRTRLCEINKRCTRKRCALQSHCFSPSNIYPNANSILLIEPLIRLLYVSAAWHTHNKTNSV